jgi:hypothetical protein
MPLFNFTHFILGAAGGILEEAGEVGIRILHEDPASRTYRPAYGGVLTISALAYDRSQWPAVPAGGYTKGGKAASLRQEWRGEEGEEAGRWSLRGEDVEGKACPRQGRDREGFSHSGGAVVKRIRVFCLIYSQEWEISFLTVFLSLFFLRARKS